MCRGLHGTHRRAKCAYRQQFEEEYTELAMEYERLSGLFREVCWYEFERQCLTWKDPWHGYLRTLHLHTIRIEHVWRRGFRHDIGHFPLYYEGHPRYAPPLPPAILANELTNMLEEMAIALDNCTAAQDWAPGGDKYNELLKGATAGAMKSSKAPIVCCDGLGDEDQSVSEQRDLLGGAPQKEHKTHAHLLGGICAGGCVVSARTSP